jgi:gliding motility-associated-like protein
MTLLRFDVLSFFGRFQYIEDFNLKIYNRWGELMIEITDLNGNWNGKAVSGNPAPAGTYTWVATYRSSKNPNPSGNNPEDFISVKERGSFVLIR